MQEYPGYIWSKLQHLNAIWSIEEPFLQYLENNLFHVHGLKWDIGQGNGSDQNRVWRNDETELQTASGTFCQIENWPHFEFKMQSVGTQLSPVLVIDIFQRTFSESFTLSPLGKFDQMVWVDQPKIGVSMLCESICNGNYIWRCQHLKHVRRTDGKSYFWEKCLVCGANSWCSPALQWRSYNWFSQLQGSKLFRRLYTTEFTNIFNMNFLISEMKLGNA